MNFFLTLCMALFFISCSYAPKPLYYSLVPELSETKKTYLTRSASYFSLETLAKKIKNYPLIFIGDHHNQDDLHKNIAHLLQALQKQGKRVLLANEWFTPEHNSHLKSYLNRSMDAKTFLEKVEWKKRIGLPFNSFKPLYDVVREGKGEIFGMNLSKSEQKNISQVQLEKMSHSEKDFYKSLDLNVNIHKDKLEPFFKGCHAYKSKSSEDCAERMYRVQVAWDSKMAVEVEKLSKKLLNDEVLVVFAGSMHLEHNIGINLRFARLSDKRFITLIPLSDKEKQLPLGLADGAIFYKEHIDTKHK